MASLAYGTINIETLLMELLQLNSLNDYRRRLNSIILHCDDFNGNSTPNRIKRSPSYLILLTFNRISVDISQRESKNTYIDCVCVCVCVCRRITGSLWHSNMSDINAITIWNGSTERNMNLCCKWTLKLYMYVFIAIRVCQLKGFIGLI